MTRLRVALNELSSLKKTCRNLQAEVNSLKVVIGNSDTEKLGSERASVDKNNELLSFMTNLSEVNQYFIALLKDAALLYAHARHICSRGSAIATMDVDYPADLVEDSAQTLRNRINNTEGFDQISYEAFHDIFVWVRGRKKARRIKKEHIQTVPLALFPAPLLLCPS